MWLLKFLGVFCCLFVCNQNVSVEFLFNHFYQIYIFYRDNISFTEILGNCNTSKNLSWKAIDTHLEKYVSLNQIFLLSRKAAFYYLDLIVQFLLIYDSRLEISWLETRVDW